MTEIETTFAGNASWERAFYRAARGVVYGFCRVYCRLTVEGKEHVPTSGSFVVAPVHRSIVDSFAASGITTRRMRYMGKASLWKPKLTRRFLSSLGGFPVDRGTADREALKRCMQVIESGEPLLLFPEGERKTGPLVQPLFDGATYVAVKTDVVIVPIGIGGSERVLPKGARFPRPRKMHMIIGEPLLSPAGVDGRVPRHAVKELSEQLHEELQRLFDAAQLRAGA